MNGQKTPRQTVKAFLQGEPPSRPLLMPILFSLGARLENLPLREFQANPTKIANALRQIRGVLKVDGLVCAFDPLLEAEALGCRRKWQDDGSCTLECPACSGTDELRGKLNSPALLADKGQVGVTCEVLRRLKVVLKDEPALVAAVAGPFTLATTLAGADGSNPQDLVEFAAEVTASVARSFVEAGADVILLAENLLPEVATVAYKSWSALLSPVCNVIRFYEALPILWLGNSCPSEPTLTALLRRDVDCVLCPALAEENHISCALSSTAEALALALPPGAFSKVGQQTIAGVVNKLSQNGQLIALTSTADLPAGTDFKGLSSVLNSLRAEAATGNFTHS